MENMRNYFGGLMLAAFTAFTFSSHANEQSQPKPDEFKELAEGIVELLKSGDAEAFAKAWSPAPEDWRAVKTLTTPAADEALARMEKGTARNNAQVLKSAQQVLAKAKELKVDFSKLKLTVQSSSAHRSGSTRYTEIQADNDNLQSAQSVTFVLSAEPLSEDKDTERLRGEYRLAANNLLKFPGGWRTYEGLRWFSFPSTVIDETAQRELLILEKAASYKGLTQDEDPALAKLGEALVRFVRSRDIEQVTREAAVNVDVMWSMFQKSGRKGPSREEFEKGWAEQGETRIIAPARAMVAMMENAGIDLSDAKIEVKRVEFNRLHARSGPGTLDGIEGNELSVTLEVRSGRKSRTGKPLSGKFVVAADEAMRMRER